MNKTTISVATIGHMPCELDKRKIKIWKSDIFSIDGDIENYSLPNDSDGYGWVFTDNNLEGVLPHIFSGNFLILQRPFFKRRFSVGPVGDEVAAGVIAEEVNGQVFIKSIGGEDGG